MSSRISIVILFCASVMGCKPRVDMPGIQKHAVNLTKKEQLSIPRYSLALTGKEDDFHKDIPDIVDLSMGWRVLSLGGGEDVFVPEARVQWSQKGVLLWSLAKQVGNETWEFVNTGMTYRRTFEMADIYQHDIAPRYTLSVKECREGACGAWNTTQFSVDDVRKGLSEKAKKELVVLQDEELKRSRLTHMNEVLLLGAKRKIAGCDLKVDAVDHQVIDQVYKSVADPMKNDFFDIYQLEAAVSTKMFLQKKKALSAENMQKQLAALDTPRIWSFEQEKNILENLMAFAQVKVNRAKANDFLKSYLQGLRIQNHEGLKSVLVALNDLFIVVPPQIWSQLIDNVRFALADEQKTFLKVLGMHRFLELRLEDHSSACRSGLQKIKNHTVVHK